MTSGALVSWTMKNREKTLNSTTEIGIFNMKSLYGALAQTTNRKPGRHPMSHGAATSGAREVMRSSARSHSAVRIAIALVVTSLSIGQAQEAPKKPLRERLL